MTNTLGLAYGHLRAATQALLETSDSTGNTLSLGMRALDLADDLEALGIEPVPIEPTRGPAENLKSAADILAANRDLVPLGIVAHLDDLRRQVD
jgi:hypothetical protein